MFIFNTATTANGFLADPHDSLEWLIPGQERGPRHGAFHADRFRIRDGFVNL